MIIKVRTILLLFRSFELIRIDTHLSTAAKIKDFSILKFFISKSLFSLILVFINSNINKSHCSRSAKIFPALHYKYFTRTLFYQVSIKLLVLKY